MRRYVLSEDTIIEESQRVISIHPLFDAVLLYRETDNEFVGFATTDHTGYYVLYNVPDGTYGVKVTAEDYDGIVKTPYYLVNDNLTIPTITILDNIYVEPTDTCGGKSPCFRTVKDGIASATDGSTINIAAGTYDEDIILDTPKELILQGGWDAAFTSQTSYTKANGLIIRQGKIITYNLILRPLIEAVSGGPAR